MSEKYSFFNAELVDGSYDRTYLAEDYAEYFASFIGNGVYPTPSTNLQVTANNTDMVVTVASGKAWINGYFYENTSNLLFTLANADGVLNRIDSIVIQLDLINRKISTVVKTGVFAVSPVATALTKTADIYEIQIATVYIGAGAIKVNQANVTDTRQDNSVCGLVSGAVEQIDTTNIFAQYTDSFNTWFNGIKGKLGTDVATNLQTEIDTINNSKGAASGIATLDANSKLVQMPTTSDIGLGNVNNTADASKAVLSATKLATARTISGVSFDGSTNITLTAANVGAIATTASCNKNWSWSGQTGQPSWLWGSNDGATMYVYNPANFTVSTANVSTYAHYSSHAVGSSGAAVRNTTEQTNTPSGGSDGDVWHIYTP